MEKIERTGLVIAGIKRCTHCGLNLPLSEYAKDRSSKDGLQKWCKNCQKRERDKKKEKLAEAKRAVNAAPIGAKTVITADGRTLHRVEEGIKPLREYSPRKLLAELKSRGYVWDNMWIKTRIEYDKI